MCPHVPNAQNAPAVNPLHQFPCHPPTKEKLVEWLFLHNKQHPIELVEAALAAKGMLPVFSNSLTQQMDHIRRVMVHSSSLLLLATV